MLCIDVQGGGESLNQLTERCVSYLNKIAQEHIGNLQTSFVIFCLPISFVGEQYHTEI